MIFQPKIFISRCQASYIFLLSHVQISSCERQFHVQRRLKPQDIHLLLCPIHAFGQQLKIEVPDNTRENQSHLKIRETLPYTVPWSIAERLQDIDLIVLVSCVAEESLRNKFVWISEIAFGVVGSPDCVSKRIQRTKILTA